jgi:hypothetical protein
MRREILKNWNAQASARASQVVPVDADSLTLSERLRGDRPVGLPNPRSICDAGPEAYSSSGFTRGYWRSMLTASSKEG